MMQILFIVLMTLILHTFARGQGQETRLGHLATREDIHALPPRRTAPGLTLQRALKTAETFIRKERLAMSFHYLYEARWKSYDTDPASGAWEFWWVSTRHGADDVRIAVSPDGKARRLSIPGAT